MSMTHPRFSSLRESLQNLAALGRWLPLASAAGVLAGSASALLLVSLNLATRVRESHHWLILLLGPVGFGIGLLYHLVGKSVEGGNNLILEETHDPRATIPLRMTPLILLGTFLTHLFGGSAGREGTAIQTGASLADQMTGPLGLSPANRRVLLMAGISAGFASVFGTPLAGTVFGFEVLAVGSLSYEALAPCLIAAFVGDLTTRAWGVHHRVYRVQAVPGLSLRGVMAAIAVGIVFGLMSMVFAKATHAVARLARRSIGYPPLRPLVGGVLLSAAIVALGTTKYIGLGESTIAEAFQERLPPYDFAAKTLFTAVTLGTGFKGGEVTPLFFIGATLGNALSRVLPLPGSLLAGMGLVGVFAGAANTPIASTLLAMELFGAEAGAYAGIACVLSYVFSGHSGIYHAQRTSRTKWANREPSPLADRARIAPAEEMQDQA